MRFISQYPGYGIQIQPQRVRPLGDGTSQVVQEPLYIRFTAVDEGAMLYDRERWLADGHFRMHGFKQHQDEATPVDSIHRLSVFDTRVTAKEQEWDEETLARVEDVLLRKCLTTPQAVLHIEGTPVDPPFPKYDSYDGDVEQLVIMLAEMGHDLEHVRYYETEFGPNRPEFVEALTIGIDALAEQVVRA